MKIISWNVNGLRAIYKKGFLDWFKKIDANIVCLQEIKAKESQLPFDVKEIDGYYSYFNSAEKKGYSGVAVYSKAKPERIEKKLGLERFDNEGRILRIEYSDFTLVNFYLPHGGRSKENLDYKLEVYKKLLAFLKKNRDKKLVIVGDFNVAHQEIDLARPRQNKNNIMFTPREREQIDNLIKIGYIDSFRMLNKNGGYYSWWPYFANARERNLGWRIDYVFLSRVLEKSIKKAFILNNVYGSDHCPVGIDLAIK